MGLLPAQATVPESRTGMKIVLLSASRHKNCTLKDVAGGFGTVFTVGNSPFARLLEVAKRRIAAIPNITLAYLHSVLKQHGAEVKILEVRQMSQLEPADLYLISSSIVDCKFEREIGREARRRYGSKVGFFGVFAANVPEFFAEAADFIVRDEIENIAPSIARGHVPNGTVSAGFVEDLDSLPYPTWEQFHIERFRYQIVTGRGITLPMLGSRGCPYTCNYCPYLVNAKYRTRSVENIVGEIEHLVGRYGIRGISFRDPNLTYGRQRAWELADLILHRGLSVHWGMEARTDRLDTGLVSLLHRAGLRCVEVGIESANEATLRANSRKAIPKRHQEAIIRHCHRLGIRVIANYTFGLPNDTVDGILETIRYAKRMNTFAIQFTVTTPYPGTQFFRNVEDRIFDHDWENFNGWTSVFRHQKISPEELHHLREFAYVSYHLRPRYVWRFLQSTILHPFLFPDPVSCGA
ncbi:MAG: radical protein [Acidobacteria bacterium]|nr:radical protein [Acidobacteriota bacterium]